MNNTKFKSPFQTKDYITTIVLNGNPLSTNSLYRHARGITYMSKAGKDLKSDYVQQAKLQYESNPLNDELDIVVLLYFGDKRKRDWDNHHKLTHDAFNKLVWEDDSQIQKALVIKSYDKDNPRVEIIIYKHNE